MPTIIAVQESLAIEAEKLSETLSKTKGWRSARMGRKRGGPRDIQCETKMQAYQMVVAILQWDNGGAARNIKTMKDLGCFLRVPH
ncbi:hypothetical protein N7517_002815 [Penicillium concentricum]|uniref:Uncharacterized protein n=1 Tax=Penicillium concentricum TaxID=293559 RepID=A0A9W9SWN4_9EURO|nr:uncharacterized protein N7517_002815 [Penicillium concentricum]KAJ5384904.1 hypothetical protein N7517_002815 [Penicillium concentricum]